MADASSPSFPSSESWTDIGSVDELKSKPLQQIRIGRAAIALSYMGGAFSAVSGACNHAGGPLGEDTLDGGYIVCPWHYWKFHRQTGQGEPGFAEDAVTTQSRQRMDGSSSMPRRARGATASLILPIHSPVLPSEKRDRCASWAFPRLRCMQSTRATARPARCWKRRWNTHRPPELVARASHSLQREAPQCTDFMEGAL